MPENEIPTFSCFISSQRNIQSIQLYQNSNQQRADVCGRLFGVPQSIHSVSVSSWDGRDCCLPSCCALTFHIQQEGQSHLVMQEAHTDFKVSRQFEENSTLQQLCRLYIKGVNCDLQDKPTTLMSFYLEQKWKGANQYVFLVE